MLWAGRADRATKGPAFVDRHRHTMREHWDHHRAHAARYPPFIAAFRYVWAAIAVALDAIWEDVVREWLLRYPSRFFGLVAIGFIIWLCLFR
jgi:hypothetical protein